MKNTDRYTNMNNASTKSKHEIRLLVNQIALFLISTSTDLGSKQSQLTNHHHFNIRHGFDILFLTLLSDTSNQSDTRAS